ncbi:MAG: carbamoyltransferase [Candidatus Melainabacteria bacterium RIFCSPLOWO2_12_FULL_35_11]|nr:MAG: carbamoyltransferase [Candidatus Melainabacteria bacterium RIFCSPLOWO2_12_FULL_35_11]
MIILGLNAYHGDSAACLVIDGIVVNAIEEERINRIKHWAGLPIESIKWCLSDAKINISDIDYIAVSRNPSAHLHKKILRALTKTPSLSFLKNRLSNVAKVSEIKSQIAESLNTDVSAIKAEVENVEHHLAHTGSSFLVSPYSEAVCVTVDGFGDFVSVMRGIGKDNKIKILDWIEFPHSLGIFYTALTQYLGFWNYGDEYKVMGLSAYGRPVYLNEMKEIVKPKDNGLFELDTSFFLHDKEGVEMVWENGQPVIDKLFSDKLIEKFGKLRDKNEEITEHHQNIASSVQTVYEEIFFHILNDTYKKTKLENLTLAGGCIQNSLANGKITEKTLFKNIYIPPASYDAGTAIGAAMVVWNTKCHKPRRFVMEHSYLGPAFSKDEIENQISKHALEGKGHLTELIKDETILCQKAAKYIEEGKIIGWFQSRTEFGPRALGNRSILVDPRHKEMKDILNERIKRREWFRPFAPSILEEKVSEWFEQDSSVPFMEKVYKIKNEKQNLIPAVCHVDGTGRLHTVSYKSNQKFYNLINEFYKLTSIPMLLNTSFNDNEPIVNSPKDALGCFLSTKMDVLILGNFVIARDKKNV